MRLRTVKRLGLNPERVDNIVHMGPVKLMQNGTALVTVQIVVDRGSLDARGEVR